MVQKVTPSIDFFSRSQEPLTYFSNNNLATNRNTLQCPYIFSQLKKLYSFNHLSNKTLSGLDNIPPTVLKHLPTKVIVLYTTIFPRSKILPTLKYRKPPDDPSSYQPMSLAPAISKVYVVKSR